MTRYSLGIDIGGTFTDIVLYDRADGSTLSHKQLTTPDAPHEGVLSGVQALFRQCGAQFGEIGRVVHATTLFTNAVLQRKGAVTGLITTGGFRDTIEMRREHKYDTYDLFIELPEPLIPRAAHGGSGAHRSRRFRRNRACRCRRADSCSPDRVTRWQFNCGGLPARLRECRARAASAARYPRARSDDVRLAFLRSL